MRKESAYILRAGLGRAKQDGALITKKKYEKNEMIVMEGSMPESLIIIEKGQVKVFRYTHEGKEQILYIFSEGDFFGEKNLLKKHEAAYNVEAMEATHVCMINKNDFQKLLLQYPEIRIKIIEELGNRMDKLESSIQRVIESEHEGAGTILKELRNITGDYKAPEDGCGSYHLTFRKLQELEADLFSHIHLENNILFKKLGINI